MRYCLFLGTSVGFTVLRSLIEIGEQVSVAFVEREHKHEHNPYFSRIVALCSQNQIEVCSNLSRDHVSARVAAARPEVLLSAGYRRYIAPEVYRQATVCSLGTHFAPLPKYRGFAPVNWAIINGESSTAVSLFHLSDGIDDGDILAQKLVPIAPDDDVNRVMERCLETLRAIIMEENHNIRQGIICRRAQQHDDATFTCPRLPVDGAIDWRLPTSSIHNLVRALTYPYPGAYTLLDGKKLTIWVARPSDVGTYVGRIPGQVVRIEHGVGVHVLTGDGSICLDTVQMEGCERVPATDVVRSVRARFGPQDAAGHDNM